MATLIDANVLIDLFTDDPEWGPWSIKQLQECALRGIIGINPVIYAEVSVAFRTEAACQAALKPLELVQWQLPYAAGFGAGKAFLKYRQQGGEKRAPLPDFYIGAHAQAEKFKLLTRDPRRYRNYFKLVDLICPD